MSTCHLDHIALLVADVDASVARGAPKGFAIGPKETFPGEGTSEIYLGADGMHGRLLYMCPAGPGPYASALQRRGPGLHHLGLKTPDVIAYVASLAGSGWYVLPQSVAALRDAGTAWLARPGVGVLLEIGAGMPGQGGCVEKLELPVPADRPDLFAALGVAGLVASPDQTIWATIAGERRPLTDLG